MLSGWFQPLRLGSWLSYPYSDHRPRVPTLHTETGGVWRRTPWPSWNPLDWASAICVHPYLPLPRQRCHSCPQHTALLLCLHFVTSSLFQRPGAIIPPPLSRLKRQQLFQLNLQDKSLDITFSKKSSPTFLSLYHPLGPGETSLTGHLPIKSYTCELIKLIRVLEDMICPELCLVIKIHRIKQSSCSQEIYIPRWELGSKSKL